uniref:Uncharacterized protein n=1 Tax=Arion vulgaris TaxID=1028688 RepID=A0A0B6Y8K0_9EUPU
MMKSQTQSQILFAETVCQTERCSRMLHNKRNYNYKTDKEEQKYIGIRQYSPIYLVSLY